MLCNMVSLASPWCCLHCVAVILVVIVTLIVVVTLIGCFTLIVAVGFSFR